MKLTKEDVVKVATLARLELTQEEQEALVDQLGSILGYVEQLQEWNTEGLELTATVVENASPLRLDEVRPCLPVDRALANAPEQEGGHFLVPKIVEGH